MLALSELLGIQATSITAQSTKATANMTTPNIPNLRAILLMLALTPIVLSWHANRNVAHAREAVTGIWYNDTGQAAIELAPCNNNVCGRIIWLRQPLNQNGEPHRDARNPQPRDRDRQICGLRIIAGLSPQDDGGWDGGRIYDPKTGKSYNVAIDRLSASRIRVTGYLGARLFGKSFTWQRAPENLNRCAT